MKAEIEEFATILIREVRDEAIQACDRGLRSEKDAIALRWREVMRNSDSEALASALIPDIVDEAIFQLLRAIDQGQLKLAFTSSSGRTVDLPEDGRGELAGWYMGLPGWRSEHSRERFIDYFSDPPEDRERI